MPPFVDDHPFGIYRKVEECRPAYPPKVLGSGPAKDFVAALLTKDRTQRLGERAQPGSSRRQPRPC